MRVAVVTPRYPPASTGGGELSTKLLATQLGDAEAVEEVAVFSFDGSGSETVDGVAVHRLGSPSSLVTEYQNLAAYRRLSGRLGAFDVVHAYNMELHPVVGYLSEAEGFPSVATLNSYHFFPKSVTNVRSTGLERLYELLGHPTTGRVLLHLMKKIDAFVALSDAIRRIYRSRGFEDARMELIPNMIDPAFDPPESGRDDDRSLLYVGSLTPNKGVGYLVEAMALLPEDYRLRIAGDGEQRAELESLATDAGVADRIEFLGRVPYEDVPDLYAAAGVFVHPGVWPEPLNRTVMEAMQAGLPVVCTDVGGPPEIIPDEELLCPPGEPQALASAIERAVDRAPAVGERNRAHVLEHHSPDVIVPRILELYSELTA